MDKGKPSIKVKKKAPKRKKKVVAKKKVVPKKAPKVVEVVEEVLEEEEDVIDIDDEELDDLDDLEEEVIDKDVVAPSSMEEEMVEALMEEPMIKSARQILIDKGVSMPVVRTEKKLHRSDMLKTTSDCGQLYCKHSSLSHSRGGCRVKGCSCLSMKY